MAKVINLTPHAIVVKSGNREVVYEPSGMVARMETETSEVGEVDGFSVMVSEVTGSNLPDPEEGVFYLVSAMVLSAFPERGDLLAPDTGNAERNDKGHIVSVPGFVSN